MTNHKHRSGIRRKVTWMISGTSLLIILISIFLSYVLGLRLLHRTVGESQSTHAYILANYVAGMVKDRVDALNVQAGSNLWQNEVSKANLKYSRLSPAAIHRQMLKMDKQWLNALADNPLRKGYLNNSLSKKLGKMIKDDPSVEEIFITDKYGGLVAASDKTSSFYQADENWWQATYAGGKGDIYISELQFGQFSPNIGISLAVPIRDNIGQVIGICKYVVNVKAFFKPVEAFKIGKGGHAALLDSQGFIIFHEGAVPLKTRLYSPEFLGNISKKPDNWIVVKEPTMHKEEKMFEAITELPTLYAGSKKVGWFLVVAEPANEVFAPLHDFILLVILGAVIGIVCIIPLGYVLGGIFTRPIKELQETTEKVIQGNWDYPIQVRTGDEIEQFADTFQKMINTIKTKEAQIVNANKEIKRFSITLEERVDERTEELSLAQQATLSIMQDLEEAQEKLKKSNIELQEAKVELLKYSHGLEEKVKERAAELSVLYELSNAIAYTMDYNQLIKLIMEAVFDVVNYDVCGALLFDATSASITLTSAYPQSEKLLDKAKGNLIKDTNALTGEDIVHKNISFTIMPSINPYQRREESKPLEIKSSFNSLFIVRGKAIGIINLSSYRGNAFDDDDIRFVHTVVNQASTAIERLQTLLKTEKSKMDAMVESMQEGVIMIEKNGAIAALNPQARRMLNVKMDEEVSTQVLETKLGINFEEIYNEFQGKKTFITKEIIVPQEQSRILRYEISPVIGTENEPIGLVVVLRDITKEKELERMKSEFISTISHELRTPLTTIRETVSQVLDGILGETTPEQRDFLNMCLEDTDRLKRIIDNLLDISKIEAKRVELRREMFDMTVLVKGIITAFTPVAATKGLEIKEKFSKENIEVYADKDKVIQIFTNLIGNALKFTEKGYIQISVTDKKYSVECSISDTGVGIAKGDMLRVFDKFQQFGRVAGPGEKGTGLGLSITKSLVELQKGTIRVESELNKGTSFIFELPKYETVKELCREYLSDKLNKAMDTEAPLAVLVFELPDYKELVDKLGKKTMSSVIADLGDLADEGLRRKADQCFKDAESFLLVLPETSKEEGVRVEERIRKVLEDYLKAKKIDSIVTIRSSITAFPEDGDTALKLLHKAGVSLPPEDDTGSKDAKRK
jgi:PAS domain S-box-containing protein